MDITDKDGLWRLTHGHIENRKTKEIKAIKDMPTADSIACMPYKSYLRKCSIAFATGEWPKTYWKSGRITKT